MEHSAPVLDHPVIRRRSALRMGGSIRSAQVDEVCLCDRYRAVAIRAGIRDPQIMRSFAVPGRLASVASIERCVFTVRRFYSKTSSRALSMGVQPPATLFQKPALPVRGMRIRSSRQSATLSGVRLPVAIE